MSGSMAVGANYLSFTAGSAGPAGTGAFSIAALVRPSAGNNNCGIATLVASGTRVRSLFEDSLDLWGENDFTGYDANLTQGTWYLIVQTKAAGSAAYNFYVWVYDASGAGAVANGTSHTVGDGSAITEIRIGQAADNANGLYAVLGVWNRQLSLAEVQSMRSNLLTTWRDVSGGPPAELIHLRDWNGTTGATIAIGTSTFSAVNGTVSAGADPPSFDFSLGTPVVIADTSGGSGSGGTSDGRTLGDGPGGSGTGLSGEGLALGDAVGASGSSGTLDGLALGDAPGGGGTGGGMDARTLGDGSGGGGTGGSADTYPTAIQDTSGGGGTGGSTDTISTGSLVVHDQMVMPIALKVRDCLVVEVGKLANPPAQVQLRPGATFFALVDKYYDECCHGIAYVRPGAQVPTTGNWPTPLNDVDGPSASRGRAPYYAVNVEIGIYRCIPTIADDGTGADNIPTAAQWLQATQEQLDDAAALRRVVCCLQAFYGLDSVIAGQVQPLENTANCGGITLNVTIRATACDCVG